MSLVSAEVISDIPWALDIWSSLSLLARAVKDDRVSQTSSLPAKVGSAVARMFCHTWTNPSGQEKAAWLSKVEISDGWLMGLVQLVGSRSLGDVAKAYTAGWLRLRLV